jgi:hypothetical protein
MPRVTKDEIGVSDRPPAMTCTAEIDQGALCDQAAEWVALSGPSYALIPAPRCLAHALEARRAGCHIRPISQQEFAAGRLDG